MQAAIDRIKMSTALKVMLAFSEPFWPDGFFDVVCTGGGCFRILFRQNLSISHCYILVIRMQPCSARPQGSTKYPKISSKYDVSGLHWDCLLILLCLMSTLSGKADGAN